MFYLNGRFMAASIDRYGINATVRGRLRRILYPYWVFAVAMLLVMYTYGSWRVESLGNALAWVFPLAVPEGASWQGGWMTEPLWYVRTYLWLLLSAAILNFIVRRGKLPVIMGWIGTAWIAAWSWGSQWWAVQNYLTFGACFMLGLFAARHQWRRIELLAVAIIGGVGVGIVSINGLPTDGVVNSDHALHLSLGLILLAVLEAVRPRLETMLVDVKRWRFVACVNERSVSIYLWHPILIGAAYLAVGRIAQGVILRAGALAAAAVMLWALLALVGVVEDHAAHKTTSRSALYSAAGRFTSGVVAAGVFMLATPAAGQYDLPPVPSQAPPSAAAYAPGPNDLSDVLLDYSSTPKDQGGALPGVYARPSDESPEAGDAADTLKPNAKPGIPEADASAATGADTTEPGTAGAAPGLRPIPRWESLAGADDLTAEMVAAVVREWVFDTKIGGVEVAVLRPGIGRFEVAIDSDGSRIAMRDTVPLASITKTFTAALLLRAVDEGLLDLREPIGELVEAPWFTMTNEITAGQLLTHRSGLVNYTETDVWERDWRKIDGWKPALEAVMDEGFSSTPGSVVSYSSTNYIVAGLLAAQIYGMPIEKLIENRVLDPLGLKSTFVGDPIPGSPGTGTGNMRASLTDVARWGMTLWRDQQVLGAGGNARLRDIDPATMIGYGSFAWCPCRSGVHGLQWASIGANGAEATVRYYPGIDLVLAMRIPGGVDVRAERLITGIVEAIQKS
jgi:CubicO group peptidase (beta-lactamase class C family)/peptidoglycan/LPS O-acetylase OafA/YrhL